jgi:hypothetical protein
MIKMSPNYGPQLPSNNKDQTPNGVFSILFSLVIMGKMKKN